MKKRLWITTTTATTCLAGAAIFASPAAFAGDGHGHGGQDGRQGGAVAQQDRGDRTGWGDKHGWGDRGDRHGDGRWDGRGDTHGWGDKHGWKDGTDDPAAVPEQPAPEQPVVEEPVVAEPVVTEPVSQVDAAEASILARTNEVRAAVGAGALTRSAEIDAVAQAWAQHLADTGEFRHNPDFAAQIPAGWTTAGENIALNTTDPAAFATQWENSPPHYANLVNGAYTTIGIGVVEKDGVFYGVQVFAGY
jgi:uncharacterized protein YkwD